jgi:hypothetical protein
METLLRWLRSLDAGEWQVLLGAVAIALTLIVPIIPPLRRRIMGLAKSLGIWVASDRKRYRA